MAFGPQGKHHSLDSYVTSTPPAAPENDVIMGHLSTTHPKQINGGETKYGPRLGKSGQINSDSFRE